MRNTVSKTNDFGFFVVVWFSVLGFFFFFLVFVCLFLTTWESTNTSSSLLNIADRIAGLQAEDVKCSS